MSTKNQINVLTEDFVCSLLKAGLSDSEIMSLMNQYLHMDHFPNRQFAAVFKAMRQLFVRFKKCPSQTLLRQELSITLSNTDFLDTIFEAPELSKSETLEGLKHYVERVELQKTIKNLTDNYNKSDFDRAFLALDNYNEWRRDFAIGRDCGTNILDTFEERFYENRAKTNSNKTKIIERFYFDDLDQLNSGRDLRGQMTCFLAATGVGKSHAARWVGSQACKDGLNVLHIQLEGSQEEVENAYSAALTRCDAYLYEKGLIKDEEFQKLKTELKDCSGKLYVKTYPRFNQKVSTVDIQGTLREFRTVTGEAPDVLVVDSMDLLTDSSGRQYTESGERHKRIAVANDLKDLAGDESIWVVVTYQSTIENPEWLNDEKNVLSEYNSAEAKGLSRPLTHLITLNQSSNERREKTMRLFVAKSRWFPKGDVFKIATDYDHEQFYDRERTMQLRIL